EGKPARNFHRTPNTRATNASHSHGSQPPSRLQDAEASSSADRSTGTGTRRPCRASSASNSSARAGENRAGLSRPALIAASFRLQAGAFAVEETELVHPIHRLRSGGDSERLVNRPEMGFDRADRDVQ